MAREGGSAWDFANVSVSGEMIYIQWRHGFINIYCHEVWMSQGSLNRKTPWPYSQCECACICIRTLYVEKYRAIALDIYDKLHVGASL